MPEDPIALIREDDDDELDALQRRHNFKTNLILFVGLPVIAVALMVIAGLTVSSRAASQDSYNATAVQLAAQERNGCITTRRNEQADQLGRLTIAANNAEAAGLLDGDEIEVAKQRALYETAVAKWLEATVSLSAPVLNESKPEGCGPPILTLDDLKETQ